MEISSRILIGLCDDQLLMMDELERLITDYYANKQIHVEFVRFYSGEEVLEFAGDFDILFLDIEMPEMDGIETGKRLHFKNPLCKIIMATGREDRYKETYGFGVVGFVNKPFDAADMAEALDNAMNKMIGMEELELYYNRVSYMVCQRDIKYVAASAGTVDVMVGSSKMRRNCSAGNMEEILDDRLFYRVSKTFIVNMLHIEQFCKGYVYIGGQEIKVAREKLKDFERKFIEFDLNYRF